MVNVKIKLLTDTAKMPTKAHSTDAAFDLYADCPEDTYYSWETGKDVQGIKIRPHETVKVNVGFATEIPEGYWGAIVARSGLSTKKGLRPANCLGVIDADYRGMWIVALHNDSTETQIIHHGDRIAQAMILPVLETNLEEVTELSETVRGTGGFASSGN